MPGDPVVAGYLAAVADDLDAARRLTAPPANRLSAYHLQQAAEKLVKAVLVHRDLGSIVWKRALGELEALGVAKVSREAGAMSVHRLVHKRARDRAEPEAWKAAATRVVEHVATWIEGAVGPAREQMDAVEARRAHVEAALAAAEQVKADATWGAIADGLARHLQHRADYVEARSLFERSLALDEKTFGPDHPNVAASLSNLATALQDLGEAARARPLLERAIAIDEKTFGPDHPKVATSLSILALVLRDLGDTAGARPLLERALAIFEARLGAEHPNTRLVRGNLAQLDASLLAQG